MQSITIPPPLPSPLLVAKSDDFTSEARFREAVSCYSPCCLILLSVIIEILQLSFIPWKYLVLKSPAICEVRLPISVQSPCDFRLLAVTFLECSLQIRPQLFCHVTVWVNILSNGNQILGVKVDVYVLFKKIGMFCCCCNKWYVICDEEVREQKCELL